MHADATLLYLAGVSVRAMAIAGLACAGVALFRVRSAAGRHAVWTFVLTGILALMVLNPLLPPLRVPVGVAPRTAPAVVGADNLPPRQIPAHPAPRPAVPLWTLWWKQAVLGAYASGALFFLAQLAIGYSLTRRLMRRSRLLSAGLYESGDISVPIAIGVWRPRILLPATWKDWDATKLRSVLAHEQAHVERWDWAILLTAAFARCLLWFHPLTWFLERHLAALAEQACDDRALLRTGDREGYAAALLDMAQSVRSQQGRFVFEGIAMAKESQVKKRIDQILDETRQISGAWSPARWLALLAFSLPLVYLLTTVQLVRAQEQTGPYQAWLQEDVSYIITAPEKAAYSKLQTDTDRARFIEQFWEQRNPTPGSSTNPFKEEHYRRLAYANEHYAADIPGWKTDRGRVYILYGPPDELESHPVGPPPFEAWRYHQLEGLGENVDFSFVDRDGTGNYRLSGRPPSITPSPATPQRIRVGGNVQAANLITKVDPVYPPLAQQARIQGTVRFSVIIGKDGRISNMQLVSGHPLLVQAAQDALRQWEYKPTLLNGQPVEVVTQVEVPFTLP